MKELTNNKITSSLNSNKYFIKLLVNLSKLLLYNNNAFKKPLIRTKFEINNMLMCHIFDHGEKST